MYELGVIEAAGVKGSATEWKGNCTRNDEQRKFRETLDVPLASTSLVQLQSQINIDVPLSSVLGFKHPSPVARDEFWLRPKHV
jgi:hypothetical protein